MQKVLSILLLYLDEKMVEGLVNDTVGSSCDISPENENDVIKKQNNDLEDAWRNRAKEFKICHIVLKQLLTILKPFSSNLSTNPRFLLSTARNLCCKAQFIRFSHSILD